MLLIGGRVRLNLFDGRIQIMKESESEPVELSETCLWIDGGFVVFGLSP